MGMSISFVSLLGGVHCMPARFMCDEYIQHNSLGEVKYLAYLHVHMCG